MWYSFKKSPVPRYQAISRAANMSSYSTGNDNPRITSRKYNKTLHNTTESTSGPLLPVEESKTLAHHNDHIYPSAPRSFYNAPLNKSPDLSDTSSTTPKKGWSLPVMSSYTLYTIVSFFTLPFRFLFFTFYIIDSVLSYLRYPLLGMVILSFMCSNLSDVYPRELDGAADACPDDHAITITTTVKKAMTSTVYPTCNQTLSTSSPTEDEAEEITEVSMIENSVKLSSTITLSDIIFAPSTNSVSEPPLSGQTKTSTKASSSKPSSTARWSTPLESDATHVEMSTVSLEERVIPSSPSLSSGAARSTTHKKRMYQ